MRVGRAAVLLFAAVLAAIGALNLVYRDFALQWQPVPSTMAHRSLLAIASGVFLIACTAGLISRRHKALAMTFGCLYLIVWLAILHGSQVLAAPFSMAAWLLFSETLSIVAAALIVLASVSPEPVSLICFARALFGLACIVFGLSHVPFAGMVAAIMPAWLPDHLAFAYLLGAAHLAVAFALLSGVLARLAATLEALMITLFLALVRIPGAVHAPADRVQWTLLVLSFSIAGSAWVIAASLGDRRWLKSKAA